MRRAVRVYFGCILVAVAAFAMAAGLTPGPDGDAHGLSRFCLRGLGVAAAVGCWRAALHMASVHRRVWPLLLATAGIVVSCAAALWALAP